MIPVATSDLPNLPTSGTWVITGEVIGQDPHLDLGKKVSTPQDLMIEELSLQNNKASRMFLERQKRMQRFIFEYPTNTIVGARNLTTVQPAWNVSDSKTFRTASAETRGMEGKVKSHAEMHNSPTCKGGAPEVFPKSSKVLQMKNLNPGVIAPGYSGPLKSVPPEKFNVTIIPKAYHSPWHKMLSNQKNEVVNVHVDVSEPPEQPNYLQLQSFNRTPIPFGGLIIGERMFTLPAFEELQEHTDDTMSNVEIMCRRRSFNRTPRGWKMRFIPESCDL